MRRTVVSRWLPIIVCCECSRTPRRRDKFAGTWRTWSIPCSVILVGVMAPAIASSKIDLDSTARSFNCCARLEFERPGHPRQIVDAPLASDCRRCSNAPPTRNARRVGTQGGLRRELTIDGETRLSSSCADHISHACRRTRNAAVAGESSSYLDCLRANEPKWTSADTHRATSFGRTVLPPSRAGRRRKRSLPRHRAATLESAA